MNIFARREVRAIEQARHVLQDEVRTQLATIMNEIQAITERWNFINERLDAFVKMFELLDKSQNATTRLIEVRLDRLEKLLRERVILEQ